MNNDKTETTSEEGAGKIPLKRLLPCPFCGGKAEWCDCDNKDCAYIMCNGCGHTICWSTDIVDVNREKWNSRAGSLVTGPDVIVDMIALLEQIQSGRVASIGAMNNVYLPQMQCTRVDSVLKRLKCELSG